MTPFVIGSLFAPARGVSVVVTQAGGKKELLKRARKTAEGAGKVRVRLKLTRAAKRKLKNLDELRIKARITFTPSGASARSINKRIKFEK